jgi:hypothetical protein
VIRQQKACLSLGCTANLLMIMNAIWFVCILIHNGAVSGLPYRVREAAYESGGRRNNAASFNNGETIDIFGL